MFLRCSLSWLFFASIGSRFGYRCRFPNGSVCFALHPAKPNLFLLYLPRFPLRHPRLLLEFASAACEPPRVALCKIAQLLYFGMEWSFCLFKRYFGALQIFLFLLDFSLAVISYSLSHTAKMAQIRQDSKIH